MYTLSQRLLLIFLLLFRLVLRRIAVVKIPPSLTMIGEAGKPATISISRRAEDKSPATAAPILFTFILRLIFVISPVSMTLINSN